MQPRVMDHRRIGGKDCRFNGWMPGVRKTTTEGKLNDIFEVEVDFIGSQRVRESIERLLQGRFKVFKNGYNFLNSRIVDNTMRSVNEKVDIFFEIQFRWKVHRSLAARHCA